MWTTSSAIASFLEFARTQYRRGSAQVGTARRIVGRGPNRVLHTMPDEDREPREDRGPRVPDHSDRIIPARYPLGVVRPVATSGQQLHECRAGHAAVAPRSAPGRTDD